MARGNAASPISMSNSVSWLLLSLCWLSLAAQPVSRGSCWKQLSSLSLGRRAEHGAAAIGNKVYVVGGMATQGSGYPNVTLLDTVEVYDTTTDQWSSLTPFPMKIHHPNVAAVNGQLYVLGGLSSNRKLVETAYTFDSQTSTWKALSSMAAGTGRGASAIGVYGKVAYIAGGTQDVGKSAVDIVSSYDAAADKWSVVPVNLPEVRDHVGGAVVGNVFYVVAGRKGLQDSVQSTVFAMDLKASEMKWVRKASAPTARGSLEAVAVGNKIYTFGGEGNPDNTTQGVFPQTEIYDVEKDSWTQDAPMRTPKHGSVAVAVNGDIYIAGGSASRGSRLDMNITEIYKPIGGC
ncbi:kelch repeat-containing protein [Venturia nashicola]|uniref:Kelch repeat-containing protein n=1 Tax=Venturia nashicola TaxID=86259 RepID=A0A4Z1PDR0_9PEZI|nr:kelch repeat-containing protein [Venturia nashicola]